MSTLILTPEAMHQGDLILVTATYPCHPLPCPDLVTVAGTQILLEKRAAQALDSLMAVIGGWEGIAPVSGWRAQKEQEAIWADSLAENGLAFTQTYVALPGHSEHQTGLAIDLGLKGDAIDFIRPDFPYHGLCQTFRQEMARFGFIQRYPAGKEDITGIGHEPWHFRYVGQPHAAIMEARGLTLEEYIAWLREFPYECCRYQEKSALVSFLPANPQGPTVLERASNLPYTVSGNNVDGFIITEWRQGHEEANPVRRP